MNCTSISRHLVTADHYCDYVPFVSTASNLVDLVQKAFRDCFIVETPSKSHYYTYLDKKNYTRCAVLLIPVIGNLIIWITDWNHAKANESEERSRSNSQSDSVLGFASTTVTSQIEEASLQKPAIEDPQVPHDQKTLSPAESCKTEKRSIPPKNREQVNEDLSHQLVLLSDIEKIIYKIIYEPQALISTANGPISGNQHTKLNTYYALIRHQIMDLAVLSDYDRQFDEDQTFLDLSQQVRQQILLVESLYAANKNKVFADSASVAAPSPIGSSPQSKGVVQKRQGPLNLESKNNPDALKRKAIFLQFDTPSILHGLKNMNKQLLNLIQTFKEIFSQPQLTTLHSECFGELKGTRVQKWNTLLHLVQNDLVLDSDFNEEEIKLFDNSSVVNEFMQLCQNRKVFIAFIQEIYRQNPSLTFDAVGNNPSVGLPQEVL